MVPPHPYFFGTPDIYLQLGGYDTALGSAADYELMLRFLYKNQIPVCYLPEVIVHMRAGGFSNSSLRQRWRSTRADRLAGNKTDLEPGA